MKKRFIKSLLATVLTACANTSFSEDIDLFLGLPTGAAQPPNILFIIDNTANWNTPFSAEMTALQNIFRDSLPPDKVNVGVMLFTETGDPNSNVDGGYIRAAIRNMSLENKALYTEMIRNFDVGDDKSNGGKAGVTLAEAYAYFAGLEARSGRNKVKTDYRGNTDGVRTIGTGGSAITVRADQDIYNLGDNALDSFAGTTYNKPPGLSCSNNFIIWVGNGPAQDNSNDSSTASAMLAALGGDTTQISISPSGSADNMADEWARFMKNSDENITMFTLDIDKVTTGQGPGWSALLESMAFQSDGQYYDIQGTTEKIEFALNDALSSILSENTVFASVALPASANTQSTFLNQVYIGMFRPTESADPRWQGNLKQYKLALYTEGGEKALKLTDAKDDAIIDPDSKRIGECARSFWTPTSVDTYWDFLDKPRGKCATVANSSVSNSPDGPIVEKGGQAYQSRSGDPAARVVKTCASTMASCTSMVAFNATNVPAGALSSDATEQTELLAWAKGLDIDDEDGDLNTTEARPSLHGDIVHTQPIALDYASDPNAPEVVVFYGGNDGALRAINGNRSSAHNSVDAGGEFWTFIPPEFFGNIKRLRDNENGARIKFPATATSAPATGQVKDYGVDGPLSTYIGSVGGTDKIFLYGGMRRGGRTLTAYDVTNINSPDVLWKRGCPNLGNDTGCTTGWENVGQTWSKAQLTDAAGYTNPLIIMGGGYDNCEDFDDNNTTGKNHNCSLTSKGNSIYVIDAFTGNIVKEFTQTTAGTDLPRAFAGSVTIVPVSDNNLDILYAYAADTGGNLFRISAASGAAIDTTVPADWVITQIASLGCDATLATATCLNPRKFLYGPDVVRGAGPDQFTLLAGSGDREKPIYDYGSARAIQNYYFAVVDEPTNSGWLDDSAAPPAEKCLADMVCLNSLDSVTIGATGFPSTDKGWKLALAAGEQVVSGSLVVADVVNFSTHIPLEPLATSCESNLGEANIYNINFETGAGIKNYVKTGGLVPTPVAGNVVLDSGEIVPFCIGCGGEGSAIGSKLVTGGASWSQPTSRVSWEVEEE